MMLGCLHRESGAATFTRSINLEPPPRRPDALAGYESSAKRTRRNPKALHEGAAKTVWILETNGTGHPFDIALSCRQSLTGFIQPQSLHKCGRRTSKLIFEAAGELPRAKRYLLRQSFDGKIIFQMGHHPGCQIGKAAAGLRLKFQRLGILFLPARTF